MKEPRLDTHLFETGPTTITHGKTHIISKFLILDYLTS